MIKKMIICLATVLLLMAGGVFQVAGSEPPGYAELYSSRFGAGARVNYQHANDMGMVWVRMPFDVNVDNYTHIIPLDNMVKKGQKQDLMMLGIINPRSNQSGTWLSADQFAEAVSLIIKRYNGDGEKDMPGLKYPIKTWEFFNEYSSNPQNMQYKGLSQNDFVEMMEAAITAARNVCPDVVILYNPFDENDAGALLNTISPDDIDIISYHTYSPLDVPHNPSGYGYFTVYYNMLERLGLKDKPVWVTEYSFEDHTGAIMNPYKPAGTFEDNARWFVQTTAWGFGSGAFEKIIYSEAVATPGNLRLEWGAMVDEDDNKRPLYYAFKKMVELIDRFTSARELSILEEVYGYEFTVQKEKIYMLWSKEGSGIKTNVMLEGLEGGSIAEVITAVPDAGGNLTSEQMEIKEGKLIFAELGETPVYVKVIPDPTPDKFTLTMSKEGEGRTDPETGDHIYDKNTGVTLAATPANGWLFDKWIIGTETKTEPTVTIVMDSDITATAYFVIDETALHIWDSQTITETEKQWRIVFNKAYDEETVNSNTVYIKDKDENNFPVKYEFFSQTELKVIPEQGQAYTPGETYTLWIKDLKSENGTSLQRNVKMDFTIEKVLKTPVVNKVTGDPGSRIQGHIPYALKLEDNRVRLYYAAAGGIYSTISTDGLNFEPEGLRLASSNGTEKLVADPTIIRTADGQFRMYYKGAEGFGSPVEAKHRMFSAISQDGLNFTREGLLFDESIISSVPEAIVLPDGRVRVYFVYFDLEDMQHNNRIRSAISNDGLNFEMEEGVRAGAGHVDPAIVLLPDNTYLMLSKYYSDFDRQNTGPGRDGIYVFHSVDGLSFSEPVFVWEKGIDPCLLHLTGNEYRVYYWELEDSPSLIKSFVVQLNLMTK